MQIVVAGNVISFPLSGLTWHIRQSSPRDTCVLWLYGIGCSGPGTGGEIGTCARMATEPASTVLSSEHKKARRSLVIGTEIQHSLRHVSCRTVLAAPSPRDRRQPCVPDSGFGPLAPVEFIRDG